VRAYATGNYLGVTANGDIYGLGPFTGNLLVPLGSLSAFETQIRADRCSVYPDSCGPVVQPGSKLNECQPLTTQSLVAGTRMRAEYVYSGAVTGTQVLDIEVGGAAVFANQNTILLTMTMTTSSPALGNSTTHHAASSCRTRAAAWCAPWATKRPSRRRASPAPRARSSIRPT
jgi:hypothetical protein